MNTGKITQISGPVIDCRFAPGELPKIKEALTVNVRGAQRVMEVAQHTGKDRVRCILLGASENLARGMEVTATGRAISVPVGDRTLGRMFNVLGETIDGEGDLSDGERWEIHRKAPGFEEQQPVAQVLETGIKVIDLLEPYPKGGKIGLFGGAGVGKTVLIQRWSTAVIRYSPASASAAVRVTTSGTKCARAEFPTRPRWYSVR